MLEGVRKGRLGVYRDEKVVNCCAVRAADVIGSLEKAFKPLEQRRHSILLDIGSQLMSEAQARG